MVFVEMNPDKLGNLGPNIFNFSHANGLNGKKSLSKLDGFDFTSSDQIKQLLNKRNNLNVILDLDKNNTLKILRIKCKEGFFFPIFNPLNFKFDLLFKTFTFCFALIFLYLLKI